jgi:hypothetical protein
MASDHEMLPPLTREAIEKVLGAHCLNPRGRQGCVLLRRVWHAMELWRERYGGLNPEQYEYADRCLSWAIWQGEGKDKPYPYAKAVLEGIANEPRVHDGMKRRAGYVKVDVAKALA